MTNYIITTKNMDMLEEAVKYVKTLLDAVDVRYIDYAIKFRESGYCIMHRINIKYHSPILFSILDSGAEDIEGIIDFDEGRINLFCLSIQEEHQYIYDYKGCHAPGTTLCGCVRTYLDNEHISYPKYRLVRAWKEIVDRNDLQNFSTTQFDSFMEDVSRYYPGANLKDMEKKIDELVYSELDSYSTQKLMEEMEMNRRFEIKKVIFNDPATIVIWANGDKTVVKAQNEMYDPEKGLAMAFAKRALGGKGSYYDVFKQWLPNEKVDFNDFEKFEKAVQKEAEHKLKAYLGERDK